MPVSKKRWSTRSPSPFDPFDKATALARHRADQALRLARVADRAARRIDAIGDRRFRDDAAIPYCPQKLVLGDDPFRVLHKIGQQVKDLRLDHDRLGAAPQLAPRDIEDIIVKRQPHAVSTTRRWVRGSLARFMTK
jgi:hypothetical protein